MKPGKAIRLIRTARGLSQDALAKKARLDQSHISLIERDQREASMSVLEEIARALRVPLYLIILLGSGPEELRGAKEEQTQAMGKELLRLLLHAEEQEGKS